MASSGTPERVGLLARVRAVVAIALVVGTFVAIIWSTSLPLTNTDTYFHLRFGREFLEGWSLRHPGSVSSFATADWVPTQWLAEVVMARVEQWGGLAAVAWLSGLQQVVLVVAVYAVARRHAEPIAAASVLVVALIACSPGLSMRPQVLSYVLVVVTAAAWLGAQRDGRVRWWLIPLTWVWAMLHGMWPVGIALGFVAVVGMLLDRAVAPSVLRRQLAVPILSALAAGCTPVGPALYPAVLLVSSRAHFFVEWSPTNFVSVRGLTVISLFAVVLVAALRRGPHSWRDISLIGFAGACALYNGRTLPLAALVLVPLAAQALQRLLPDRGPLTPGSRERLGVAALAAGGLVTLAVLVPHTAADPLPEPGWAPSALEALPPGTPVVNAWDLGGYLMWRYPNLDLVMHGYGDTFTDDELNRNLSIGELRAGWDDQLIATGARYAVLAPGSRLAYALVNQESWRVLHVSPDLEMLEAPATWPSR